MKSKYFIERVLWICIVLFLLFCLLKSCSKNEGTSIGNVTVSTIVKYDTIQGRDSSYYIPINTPVIIRDTIIDSIEYPVYVTLPQEYFPPEIKPIPLAVSLYVDTLSFGDSVGYAIVKDTVAGKILKRTFDFSIFNKFTFTNTEKTKEKKSNLKIYGGGEFSTNYKALGTSNYIGLGALAQLPNEDIYKVSYGVINKQQLIGISFFKKIKLK